MKHEFPSEDLASEEAIPAIARESEDILTEGGPEKALESEEPDFSERATQDLDEKLRRIQESLPAGLRGSLPHMAQKIEDLSAHAQAIVTEEDSPEPAAAATGTHQEGTAMAIPEAHNLDALNVSLVVEIDGKEVEFVGLTAEDMGFDQTPEFRQIMNADFLSQWSQKNLPEGKEIALCNLEDGMNLAPKRASGEPAYMAIEPQVNEEGKMLISKVSDGVWSSRLVGKTNGPGLINERMIFRLKRGGLAD